MILWPFMPESPTWLIIKGRDAQAAQALKRLGYEGDQLEQRMSMIKLTLAQAKQETEGVTYAEWCACFGLPCDDH